VYYIDACFTKTVAPVEQSKHIAHSQCDVTKTIRIHRYPKHLFQNREDLFFMKNKTKVILGLAAMLAGTVGVAGVSTFAWFTTQNTASISFEDAHVVSDSETVTIDYVKGSGANCGITDAMVTTAGVTTNPRGFDIANAKVDVRDVSSDGVNFYRPQWNDPVNPNAAEATAKSIDGPLTQSSTASKWVEFQMTVSNKGQEAVSLYIESTSHLEALASSTNAFASSQAALATRVSLSDGATVKSIWQPNSDTAYKALKKNTEGTGQAYGLTNAPCDLVDLTSDTTLKEVFHEGAYSAVGSSVADFDAKADKGQKVVSLAAVTDATNSTKVITVRAWIDGTITAADNDCIGGDVSWTLSFKAIK
jgi:hypothetical protein